MLCKDDWDKVKERYNAFWNNDMLDRVAIQVSAPSREADRIESGWHTFFVAEHPEEPELIVEEFVKYVPKRFWGGELFPLLNIYLGAGSLAAYLGCNLLIREDTIWFEEPGDLSLGEIASLEIDPDNRWYKATLRLAEELPRLADGRFFVGLTDLNAEMNVLGALRGTQRLLFDLVDAPGKVRAATEKIHSYWVWCTEAQLERLQTVQDGSAWWMGCWAPGKSSDLQCDFSAMISPGMFEEFVLPEIEDSARRLDHSVFHWDGPGQILHLDHLLSIEELDGLQWVPGAGNPGTGSPEWFPLYKRIQDAGKVLVLQGMDKNDVKDVLETLDPKGLLIGTSCDSEEEARDLLKQVEKWSLK